MQVPKPLDELNAELLRPELDSALEMLLELCAVDDELCGPFMPVLDEAVEGMPPTPLSLVLAAVETSAPPKPPSPPPPSVAPSCSPVNSAVLPVAQAATMTTPQRSEVRP
jgi:hypothetical protein